MTQADLVVEVVAGYYGVSATDLKGPSRAKELIHPRWVAMYVLYLEGYTLAEAGRALNRHHTTAIYAIRSLDREHDDAVKDIRTILRRRKII